MDEALEIDKREGNTFWQNAINKETYKYRVDFKSLDQYDKSPVVYNKIICNFIFDIKMDITKNINTLQEVTWPTLYSSLLTQASSSWIAHILSYSSWHSTTSKLWRLLFKMPILMPQPRRGFSSTQEMIGSRIKEGRLSLSDHFTVWSTVHSHGGTICMIFLVTSWTSSWLSQTLIYGWNPWQPQMVSNNTHTYWFM